MAVNARIRINELFGTEEEAKAFDYLVRTREPTMFYKMKNILGVSVEKTKQTMDSLEKKNLVESKKIGILDSSVLYTTNADSIQLYMDLERTFK
jgi:hypothetical protein